MEKDFELCTGRDGRGRVWCTRMPVGVARVGMYIRLVGGTFLLVHKVERGGRASGRMAVCAPAQALVSVWEGRGNA